MSEWKTYEEILPEIGQLMQEDSKSGYKWVERRKECEEGVLPKATNWADVFIWDQKAEYRIKPRTLARTVTYPEPLREKPECGDLYWTIHSPAYPLGVQLLAWTGELFDELLFKRGVCFATKEDAQAAFNALFGGEK